ncbi:MAG TPA: M1 family metallopeptidase [Pyrinomonadaceae bacterium]|nr:M1 family metallopeptidase [Pyrinomonadaceae bacterium]
MRKSKLAILSIAVLLQVHVGASYLFGQATRDPRPPQAEAITRQETLRGSVTPEREWWDVLHYHLQVEFLPETRRLRGSNTITFKTLKPGNKMQIDLQPPLAITKITYGTKIVDGRKISNDELKFVREGNVYWVMFEKEIPKGVEDKIEIFYEGVPVVSKNPPWVGGVTWGRDDLGEPLIVTTCEGIGASIWWPNKDHGADEPDRGMQIDVTVPENLVAVSNGRLKKIDHDVGGKKKTFHWEVLNPINNYGVNVNIGNYINLSEKYKGKGGVLDIEYWVLPHQKEAALRQFKEVPRMLEAFEHWFGKYPFYEDGYKLVTVPYPGMEHQSSVTYGNWFRNGYLQRDPCACGVGLKFDFIIVHESAHEWFGNNISMKDAADMWIHEGFANYAENLFVEYHFGKKDAEDYVIGTRRGIRNDRPIIGTYGSNREGSGDMYPKGGNMLHTIRHVINDDAKWLSILRGLSADFWHQTVTTKQIESYISTKSGIDLSKVFDQYLRTTNVPLLKYNVNGKSVSFYYERVVKGFAMPIRVNINGKEVQLTPNEVKQTFEFPEEIKTFELNRNFYIEAAKQ